MGPCHSNLGVVVRIAGQIHLMIRPIIELLVFQSQNLDITLLLVTNMQALGELLEKKQP